MLNLIIIRKDIHNNFILIFIQMQEVLQKYNKEKRRILYILPPDLLKMTLNSKLINKLWTVRLRKLFCVASWQMTICGIYYE